MSTTELSSYLQSAVAFEDDLVQKVLLHTTGSSLLLAPQHSPLAVLYAQTIDSAWPAVETFQKSSSET
jgi:hypothetical protein